MNKTLILADIEKAFHQIGLKSTERNYLRFLWYENATDNTAMKKIVTYRFCRVPFGIISSQFILAAVIIFLLKQNITKFTELILNHLYVDNLIVAVESTETAIQLFDNAMNTFSKASLNLRAWASNDQQVLKYIPREIQDTNGEISILGIHWNKVSDDFRIRTLTKNFNETNKMMKGIL